MSVASLDHFKRRKMLPETALLKNKQTKKNRFHILEKALTTGVVGVGCDLPGSSGIRNLHDLFSVSPLRKKKKKPATPNHP